MATQVRNIEIQADRSFALRAHPDNWVNSRLLAASTPEYVTVPTITTQAGGTKKARYVVFSATGDFYAKWNATVVGTGSAIPADVSDGTANVLNPTIRYLGDGVAEIGLISAGTPTITMEFFY